MDNKYSNETTQNQIDLSNKKITTKAIKIDNGH